MWIEKLKLLFVVGWVLLGVAGAVAGEPTFAHDEWSRVLSRFVDDRGLVDYEAMAHDRATFDRYIAAVETASPKSNLQLFPSRNHELAYYINAYNALVFKGVLARGPEQESVWKGGLVSGYKFFVSMKFTVGGERTSLKKLEDKVIRDGFQDPRVHAALNCASISCPRLPQRAFDPEHLDEELDAAMTEFVQSDRHVRVVQASRTVQLSKIFDWFSKDFLSYEKRQGNVSPSLIDYVNRYRGERSKIPRDLKVRFLEYDKGINTQ